MFDVAFAPKAGASGPGAGAGVGGSNADWTTTLLVNGSAPPPTATPVSNGVIGLPVGRHQFSLQLVRKDGLTGNETWARVEGVQGTMGGLISASTANVTIDDTAWANGSIGLSEGWNMLEDGRSNYINETQFNIERNNADRHYNRSISWTTQEGALNSIAFSGSAVWLYGLSGGEAGTFEVHLDNVSQGVFNAAGGPRTYNQTLWHISGITDGPHTVELINRQGRLSFDRLVATTGINQASMDDLTHKTLGTKTGTAATAIATGPVESSAAAAHKENNTAMVVGASVGSVLGVLFLTLAAFLIWSRCRRRNKQPNHAWQEKKPWYRLGRDKGWNFVSLVDEPHKQMAQQTQVWDRVSRSDKFKSFSSFGSSASQLHQPAPAHTRRSLLPLANNLWAKAKKGGSGDSAHQMTDISSLKPPSPDPMAFALNGGQSPLTQLQRSFSSGRGEQRPRVQPKDKDPAVGTREWYDWFRLSTYSDRLSTKSGRSAPRLPQPAHAHDPTDGSGNASFGLARNTEYALGEDHGAPQQYYYNDMPLSPQKRYM